MRYLFSLILLCFILSCRAQLTDVRFLTPPGYNYGLIGTRNWSDSTDWIPMNTVRLDWLNPLFSSIVMTGESNGIFSITSSGLSGAFEAIHSNRGIRVLSNGVFLQTGPSVGYYFPPNGVTMNSIPLWNGDNNAWTWTTYGMPSTPGVDGQFQVYDQGLNAMVWADTSGFGSGSTFLLNAAEFDTTTGVLSLLVDTVSTDTSAQVLAAVPSGAYVADAGLDRRGRTFNIPMTGVSALTLSFQDFVPGVNYTIHFYSVNNNPTVTLPSNAISPDETSLPSLALTAGASYSVRYVNLGGSQFYVIE